MSLSSCIWGTSRVTRDHPHRTRIVYGKRIRSVQHSVLWAKIVRLYRRYYGGLYGAFWIRPQNHMKAAILKHVRRSWRTCCISVASPSLHWLLLDRYRCSGHRVHEHVVPRRLPSTPRCNVVSAQIKIHFAPGAGNKPIEVIAATWGDLTDAVYDHHGNLNGILKDATGEVCRTFGSLEAGSTWLRSGKRRGM